MTPMQQRWNTIFSWFKGEILEETTSEFHGSIIVQQYQNDIRVIAGGLYQCGAILRTLWKKPLKLLNKREFMPDSILILGAGGGSMIETVVSIWPQAQITGVEIDPVMLRIGKQYFAMESKSNVTVQLADAFIWVNNALTKSNRFSLVIVDMFQGDHVSPQITQTQFLTSLRNLIKPGGLLLVNTLFYNGHKHFAAEFVRELDSEFKDVELVRHLSNLFIIARPKGT